MMRAALLAAVATLVACGPDTSLTSIPGLPVGGPVGPVQSDLVPVETVAAAGTTVVLPIEAVGGPPAPLVTPGEIVINGFAAAEPVSPPGVPVSLRLDLSKASWTAPNRTVTAAIVLRGAGGAQEGEVYRPVRIDQRSLTATIAGPTPRTAGTKTVELRLLDPRSNQEVGRAAPIQVNVSSSAPVQAPAEG